MTRYATSERTRTALVTAAGELFAEKGVSAVSTRAIAERAGENVGSIHYHFGGKDGLLTSVIGRLFESWGDEPGRYIREHESLFGSESGKATFLRGLADLHFSIIFNPRRAWWESPLFFQMFTNANPISEQLTDEWIRPHIQALEAVARRLRPDFTALQAIAWANCFIAQITHFSLLKPTICRAYGMEVYNEAFLREAKERVIENTTRGIGLPYEKDLID